MIYLFITSYLHPELIFKDSIPTGGDYASHYYTLVYLQDHLLPQGRLVGWNPGNYAGFPQFQMYFPLTFLLMVLGGLFLPLTISFKVVSLAGVLLLPFGAYRFFRNLNFNHSIADLAAGFTVAYLFVETSPAFGGKVTSTLAGEFSFAWGLFFSLLYLGRLYRDLDSKVNGGTNALLLALVGFCHGYPLLFCVLASGFFLITTHNWIERLAYLLKVNLWAFCFMGFWIVPLLAFSPYTTPFNFVWIIHDWREILPVLLLPYIFLALAGTGWILTGGRASADERTRIFYFLYLILIAIIFYFIAFKIGVVDVRFLPLAQLFGLLLGVVVAGRLLTGLKAQALAVLVLTLVTVIWTAHLEKNISQWAGWNLGGWEEKPLWPAFNRVMDELKGDFSDPRVVYEHAALTNATGTIRAFESTPLFAGRAVLEGVYIQASLSVPFVFYIQAQVSQNPSTPLSQYYYGRFDLEQARPRLELFNVGHYITADETSKSAALKTAGFELAADFHPFAVFRLTGNSGRYVVQPAFRPVLALSRTPKKDSFAWFRGSDLNVPLVLSPSVTAGEKSPFAAVLSPEELPGGLTNLPAGPLPPADELTETVRDNEIIVAGATPGRPLLVKVSYHPNWRVEGADRVWRAAPSFMLVFPCDRRVRLYYGWGWPDYAGLVLTVLAVAGALWTAVRIGKAGPVDGWSIFLHWLLRPLAVRIKPVSRLVLKSCLAVLGAVILYLILVVGYEDPTVYYNRGLALYDAEEYAQASRIFEAALVKFPLSPRVDQTLHHLALSYYKQGEFGTARRYWTRFETDYPESRLLPEALFHIGLCYQQEDRPQAARGAWQDLAALFPETRWGRFARQRLEAEKNTTSEAGQ